MANSILFAGERAGARIFRVGRIGFDSGTQDVGSTVYTGTYKTQLQQPAGPGALVNFRRVAIDLLYSGTYTFTVTVYVDGIQTTLADGSAQSVTLSGGSGAFAKATEEVKISANGSEIQVVLTVNSDDLTGVFLVEGISVRGRVIRNSATRTGSSS